MESNEANVSALYVPPTITTDDGIEYPVKVVGANAFAGNPWIVRIYYGEGIEEIQTQSCKGCSNLELVTFPSTLKKIYSPFYGCNKMKDLTIYFPSGLEYIGDNLLDGLAGLVGRIYIPASVTYVGASYITSDRIDGFISYSPAFKTADNCLFTADGTELLWIPSISTWKTEYTIPQGVTKLRSASLSRNTGLANLIIPEGVVYAQNALGYLPKLTTINLPSTLSESPFSSSYTQNNLTEINVAKGNEYFSSIDGVLFNSDGSVLYKYPTNKQENYIVPSTVKCIGAGAFRYARCKSITLNEGLNEVRGLGIAEINYMQLPSLRIPNSLTTFAKNSFFGNTFEKFEVDDDHPSFSTDTDGHVLYSKDKTVAYTYTNSKSATGGQSLILPSTVNSLKSSLVYWNQDVEIMDLSNTSITDLPDYSFTTDSDNDHKILLPDTLISMRVWCIMGRFSTLTIPKSVNLIENSAFSLTRTLEIIFLNPGKFNASSIFHAINKLCVIKGYRGSTAEDIARQYTLMFEPLD